MRTRPLSIKLAFAIFFSPRCPSSSSSAGDASLVNSFFSIIRHPSSHRRFIRNWMEFLWTIVDTLFTKKKKKRVSHYRSANRPTDNKCRRGCDDNYGSWLTSRSSFDFFFFHSFARRSDMKYSNGQRSLIRRPFSFSFSSFSLSLGSNRCRIANNVLPPSPCRSLPQLRE